ncbi:MAG: FliI/YscN family ATPase [Zetaproteobacteria bacterium]|nr:FliI/YscN family ATPase [Zetaproteobacteria bacterium]
MHPLWCKSERTALLTDLAIETQALFVGKVSKVVGTVVEAAGLQMRIGQSCKIMCSSGVPLEAELVGFQGQFSVLMPSGSVAGIAPGDAIYPQDSSPSIYVSEALLGKVINALGQPLDGTPLPENSHGNFYPLSNSAPNPLLRGLIEDQLQLGVRTIDACLPIGTGQRIGLFAGAGVGKSTLMGMIARYTAAEVNIIVLTGERGRELREFLERALDPASLSRTIVVTATSDEPPLLRMRAALTGTAIAEWFRDQGKQVLLLMDSLTRFMQAQREIGLTMGEPPTNRGYTPSCFSSLASLLERAGPGIGGGSITAIYTVLMEGDVTSDPVADAARAALDGHVVLDRALASKGHYPPIDLLGSTSRLATVLLQPNELAAVNKLRKMIAKVDDARDLIQMGAYEAGNDAGLDQALKRMPEIERFLVQEITSGDTIAQARSALFKLVEGVQ